MRNILITHVIFFLTGLFAGHHIYLERFAHAFLSLISFHFFGFGLLYDFLHISQYVEEQKNISAFPYNTKTRPPLNFLVITYQIFFGLYFYNVFYFAWPPFRDISKMPSLAFGSAVPSFISPFVKATCEAIYSLITVFSARVGIAVAFNLVGGIFRTRGPFWQLFGIFNILEFFFAGISDVLKIIIVVLYYQLNRKWPKRQMPQKQKSADVVSVRVRYGARDFAALPLRWLKPRGLLVLSVFLFYSAIFAGVVNHAGVTLPSDLSGEESKIYFRDGIFDFFHSDFWHTMKSWTEYLRSELKRVGWRGIFDELNDQIIDRKERHDEIEAYRLLKLAEDAPDAEIKERYRQLALEWHPDRKKDGYSKEEQQLEFIRFKKAYQLIEKKRAERSREAEMEDEMVKSRSHEMAKEAGGGSKEEAEEAGDGAEKNEL